MDESRVREIVREEMLSAGKKDAAVTAPPRISSINGVKTEYYPNTSRIHSEAFSCK